MRRTMKVIKFTITTIADGSYASTIATAPGSDLLDGEGPWFLYAVEWVDTNFDAGVDAVLSTTSRPSGHDYTLLTLTNADAEAIYYPRVLVQGVDGANLVAIYDLPLVYGTLKLAVTAGGNAKTGAMWVYLTDTP